MSTAPAQASPAESARAEGHAFRSGRHAPLRSASGAQAQLDSLARAGVVTHVVGHGEAIDPLFAVSQLRDLPEVRFVAAFREGVIALGCPDGLPDQLQDLAAPISAPAEVPNSDPTPDFQPTLDAILQRLTMLEGPAGLGAINERLTSLDTMNVETARLVGDLAHAAAEKTTEDPKEVLKEFLEEPLSALQSNQDTLASQIATSLIEVSERMKGVEEQIDAARRESSAADHVSVDPVPEPPTYSAELEALSRTLPQVSTGLNRIEEALSGAIHQGNERLDEVLNKVAQLSEADGAPQENDIRIDSIEAHLEEIRRHLEAIEPAAPQADNTATLRDTPESAAERTAILAALAQMQDNIDGLAARPDPVLDLTTQRQSFAQFGTVMKMVVQRLEGTADQIKDSLKEAAPAYATDQESQLSAQIDALPDAIVDALRKSPEAASVLGQLIGIKEQLNILPITQEHVEGLDSTLQSLANRPKPVLDLSEQRRSFAGFTTALATVVQRLEKSADRFADVPDTETGENPILALIAQLPEKIAERIPPTMDLETLVSHITKALPAFESNDVLLAELQALPERIEFPAPLPLQDTTAVETQISTLAKEQALVQPALAALGRQIDALAAMPAPVIDVTEQRASFAMFSTALAAVVGRLERAIAAASDAVPATENTEIGDLVRSIYDTISSQKPDTLGFEDKLKTLDQLAVLPTQIAEMKSSFEAQLATQQTPHLDLTAQRQSLARFATAAQQVISRLEAVIAALPKQVDAKDEVRHRPLVKRMRRLEGQLEALRTTQDDTAANLMGFLETLALDPDDTTSEEVEVVEPVSSPDQSETAPVRRGEKLQTEVPSFEAAAPLDSLRFCFAEMIAAQIRNTAQGATKTA